MRMLNYSTANANPFHQDHHSQGSSNYAKKRYIKGSPSGSLPTARTSQSTSTNRSYISAENWSRNEADCTKTFLPEGDLSTRMPRVIANPPATFFARVKDPSFNDDSVLSDDTYSDMTYSLGAFSSSSSTAWGDHVDRGGDNFFDEDTNGHNSEVPKNLPRASRFQNGPGSRTPILKPANQDQSNLSSSEMVTKGKFSGMTLRETLTWRRHVSNDQNEIAGLRVRAALKGSGKFRVPETKALSSQASDTQLSRIGASAKVKKRIEQAKANSITESKNITVPDFMLVRAQLKKAKHRAARVEIKSDVDKQGSVSETSCSAATTLTVTSDSYAPTTVTTRDEYLSFPHFDEQSIGVECVRVDSDSEGGEQSQPLTCTDTDASCSPELFAGVKHDKASDRDLCVQRQGPVVQEEIAVSEVAIPTTAASTQKEEMKQKLNSMFAQRLIGQLTQKKRANTEVAVSGTTDDKEKADAKQNLNSMFAQRLGQVALHTTTTKKEQEDVKQKLNSIFTQRPGPVVREDCANAKIAVPTSPTIKDMEDVKQKLNSMFAQRLDQAMLQNKPEGTSHHDPNHPMKGEHLQDTLRSIMPQRDQKTEVSLSKKNMHEKLNSLLAFRKPPPTQSTSNVSECIVSSSLIARSTTVVEHNATECRDDVELQQRKDSDREPSDPKEEHTKYTRMLKMGIPIGAVKNAMLRDGVDPSVVFGQREGVTSSAANADVEKCKKDPYKRTRLHWVPVENYSEDSIWHQINLDTEIGMYCPLCRFFSLCTFAHSVFPLLPKRIFSLTRQSSNLFSSQPQNRR